MGIIKKYKKKYHNGKHNLKIIQMIKKLQITSSICQMLVKSQKAITYNNLQESF